MLILTSFVDRWVRYNEIILGSDGSGLNPFWAQNKLKSLKSDLYALIVLLAFELLRFNKVSFSKIYYSQNCGFILFKSLLNWV